MIGIPENWYEFDPVNSTIMIYDIQNRTDFDWNRYYQLSNRVVNSKEMTNINILGPYYTYDEYYDSIVLLPFNINQTTVIQI